MARREWAEREAEKLIRKLGCNRPQDVPRSGPIELAYLAEHARAVRIVKARIKQMEGATPYQWEKGYQSACADILAAIQKGRA